MKNIEILCMAEDVIEKHRNDSERDFEIYINNILNEFNGLGKKCKFLRYLIIEFKLEKKKSEKNMILLDNASEKKNNRVYIEDISQKIRYLKEIESTLKKEKKLKNRLKDETSKKLINNISFTNNKKEVKDKTNIDEIVTRIDDYDLNVVLASFSDYIKNIDLKNDYFENEYLEIINDKIVEHMVEENEICQEFYSLINLLKNKALSYEKGTEERKVLKAALNKLKESYKIYSNDEKKESIDPYFNILDYWLHDDSNYLYIKELLKRKREICNLRYNDKHIVNYILDLYIDNFKKMIKDKNSNYININYLKEVYFLFTKNHSLRMSTDEKEEIDLKLKEFKSYIKNTLIKQKRKNAAIEDIKSLSTRKYYVEYSYYDFEEFTDDVLCYEKGFIMNNVRGSVKGKEYKDAFLFGNYAYNIEKEDNNTILTMYSIDISNYTTRNSLMDRYLEKCEILKEKVDEFTAKSMRFKKDEIYPVFAYELEFYPSGKFKNLNVKKDVIRIRERYLNNITSDETKKLHELYKKSTLKNGGNYSTFDLYALNYHFEDILNNAYIKFLSQERLPFIYYGYTVPTEQEVNDNINNLNEYLYNLDKYSSKEIINIFSNRIDINHYSNLPIPNGVYDLKLMNPFSYLGLENERMLNELYFNQRKYEDLNRLHILKLQYLNEYIKKVQALNKNIGYVDPTEIKMSKGKIKNRIHL